MVRVYCRSRGGGDAGEETLFFFIMIARMPFCFYTFSTPSFGFITPRQVGLPPCSGGAPEMPPPPPWLCSCTVPLSSQESQSRHNVVLFTCRAQFTAIWQTWLHRRALVCDVSLSEQDWTLCSCDKRYSGIGLGERFCIEVGRIVSDEWKSSVEWFHNNISGWIAPFVFIWQILQWCLWFNTSTRNNIWELLKYV